MAITSNNVVGGLTPDKTSSGEEPPLVPPGDSLDDEILSSPADSATIGQFYAGLTLTTPQFSIIAEQMIFQHLGVSNEQNPSFKLPECTKTTCAELLEEENFQIADIGTMNGVVMGNENKQWKEPAGWTARPVS